MIGWSSDVENWTQEDLEAYFRTYYAPNNLTMVFAGDVTPEEIFDLADDYFASIPAQEPPAAVRTVEPEQLGARRFAIEVDAPTPLLHVTFRAGSATDSDTQALNVLLNILTGGASSRLHQLLVEDEQIVLDIGGFQMEGFDPGLAYFYLTLPPDADVALAEARLLEELERVAIDGVSEAELAKARNIMVANFWRGAATIDGKASAIGNAEVFFGDYQRAFSLPDELDAISVEDVKSVAAKTFNRRKMTVGILQSPDVEVAE